MRIIPLKPPVVAMLTAFVIPLTLGAEEKRPNILWIIAEDLSPFMGCYGDEVNKVHTPAIDKLAAAGVLYRRAYVNAPVCSSCRSGLITGVMQTTAGIQQHRSSRFTDGQVVPENLRIHLPAGMKTLPELMKGLGYFTFNSGKDDYNFHYDRRALYDVGTDPGYVAGMNGWQGNRAQHSKSWTKDVWSARPDKNQPWFGQIQIDGGKGDRRNITADQRVDRASVTLPPYFPEAPAAREAWAVHYDEVRGSDVQVARILAQLEADGERDNTIVIFFSDHGSPSSLRHKQFCYEGGLHVPLIIAGTHPSVGKGKVVTDMVSLLDVTATTLALAGGKIPDYYEGRNLVAPGLKPAEFIVSARDRCDYTIDMIRTIRTDRMRYIRNFHTDRPLMQGQYRDDAPYTKEMWQLHREGKLNDYQERHWFGVRPLEELYDMQADPHQVNNLATDPRHRAELLRHRRLLDEWMIQTDDQGMYMESPAQLKATYDLWADKPIFMNIQPNPEFNPFRARAVNPTPDR